MYNQPPNLLRRHPMRNTKINGKVEAIFEEQSSKFEQQFEPTAIKKSKKIAKKVKKQQHNLHIRESLKANSKNQITTNKHFEQSQKRQIIPSSFSKQQDLKVGKLYSDLCFPYEISISVQKITQILNKQVSCLYESITGYFRQQNLSCDNICQKYSCPECGKLFLKACALGGHISSVHSQNRKAIQPKDQYSKERKVRTLIRTESAKIVAKARELSKGSQNLTNNAKRLGLQSRWSGFDGNQQDLIDESQQDRIQLIRKIEGLVNQSNQDEKQCQLANGYQTPKKLKKFL